MRRGGSGWWLAALVVLALWAWQQAPRPHAGAPAASPSPPAAHQPATRDPAWPAFLPAEAIDTLQRIGRDGPFPYRQDGAVFENREQRLPPMPRGYYREYTVATPGARDRGARRIISGGQPPREYFYSDDHYRSFRRFEPH